METLLQLDQALFHFINEACKNAFFDWLLPLWRNKFFWIPLYIILIGSIIKTFGNKSWWLIIGLLITIGISDATSSHLIKNQIQRIRPCNQVGFKETAHLLVPCGSGYSFTSSHATNHFALAFFLILTIGRRWKWVRVPLFFWACSIALAQVYVGVHYPLDIVAGGMLGMLISFVMVYLLNQLNVFRFPSFHH